MVNYQNTIIYKIQCKDQELCCLVYYGSTTNMRVRKTQHISMYNNINCKDYNDKKYVTIRENGGWNNWEMVEVEKFPCDNCKEKRIREQYWINKSEKTLNMIRSYIAPEDIKEQRKDYYQNNKEEIKEKVKQYANNNKEKIKVRGKKYREKNKGKLKDYRVQHRLDNLEDYRRREKERTTNWTDEQKEHKKSKKHDWYIANKERLSEKNKRRTECGCGTNYVTVSKTRHEKTQKHLKWISQLPKV